MSQKDEGWVQQWCVSIELVTTIEKYFLDNLELICHDLAIKLLSSSAFLASTNSSSVYCDFRTLKPLKILQLKFAFVFYRSRKKFRFSLYYNDDFSQFISNISRVLVAHAQGGKNDDRLIFLRVDLIHKHLPLFQLSLSRSAAFDHTLSRVPPTATRCGSQYLNRDHHLRKKKNIHKKLTFHEQPKGRQLTRYRQSPC